MNNFYILHSTCGSCSPLCCIKIHKAFQKAAAKLQEAQLQLNEWQS